MTKTQARMLFLDCLGGLLTFVSNEGIDVLLYDFHRSAEEQALKVKQGLSKVKHSQHQEWLAADFVLIGPGEKAIWTHTFGDAYEKMGMCWESLHPLCRWGGRFGRVNGTTPGWDAGHFEVSRDYASWEA